MTRRWENILAKIVEKREIIKKREVYPYDTFLQKTYQAILLLDVVESSKTNIKIKIEARKNFIVNCVTALEVFLRDMIEGLIDMNVIDQKRINEFLNDKITLKEAWEIFSERNITLGEIISATCSFQNLHQINSIFSKLFDQDFLEEINRFEVEREDGNSKFTLREDYPEWQKRIAEMFELRHKFVHQISLKDRLGINRLGELWENFSAFADAIESYLLQFVPEVEE
ncbi:MAG: hypothetical protein AYK18_13520 [Theionarchaea archaeon DG-70]|nr:MAG: hypothetical protein AYK18_13520 [Theionarchaea archaeon DG-70]